MAITIQNAKEVFEDYGAVIGDEAHLFKVISLTKIMTKLVDCKYRIGLQVHLTIVKHTS